MTYPGGKGRAYQRIISLMPPHATYIETHLGGGSILRRKRPARRSFAIDVDEQVIAGWRATRMAGVEFVQGCAVRFLRQFDFAGDELVYSDPPYWPDMRRRTRCYRHDYTREDHLELLATLTELPCRVMLSGYTNAAYDKALAGWNRHAVANQTQVGAVEETLWTNFTPDHRLHDYSYVGEDFRERERIRRGRITQIERLRRASPIERAAMLSDIVDTFPEDVIALAERVR
jgi:site-specific DNA-adenine methylase